jgi:type II secretion system protein N
MDLDLKLTPWQRRAAYAAFAAAAFLLALRQTFPTEAVKERLVMEAAARGWQVRVADVRPAGLLGVGMTSLAIETRDGARIPLERLEATLRPWSLLRGRRGVSFDASLYEGRVRGFAEEAGTWHRIAATVEGLDLSRAAALRRATGVDLGGVVQGDVDLTLDDREPAKSAGHLALSVQRAAVNGGELPIPGMGGALTLPRVALGQLTARAVARDGKLTFEKLETKGEDLEASGDGLYCVLQPRLAFAPMFGKLTLRVRDAFWQKSSTAGFKSLAEMALAPARGRDGAYGFQLYGTLSQPQARMAP